VDEFQDTDPDQVRLLATLLRKPSRCEHEILCFFVGDTKQSIYRFRGVDIRSVQYFFERFERIIGCSRKKREFYLQTNFRSTETIAHFVNHLFSKQFQLTGRSDHLIPFRDSLGTLPEWIAFDRQGEEPLTSSSSRRGRAALATANLVLDYIHDRHRKDPCYSDILILVRDRQDLDTLLPCLHEAGIPVVASETKTYYRHHEVLDLLNLLISLHHSQDSLAVAAVLRSPLIHLSDEQIHQLLLQVPSDHLFFGDRPIPESVPEVPRRRIAALRQLAENRRLANPHDWLHAIRFFIPKNAYIHSEDYEGRSIVRINRLLKAFGENLTRGREPPLVWLLKRRAKASLGDHWDADFGEDVNVSDESVDAVRVMTIHKAKGLDGRFVIVYSWASILAESAGQRNGRGGEVFDLLREDTSRLRTLCLNWGPLRIVTPALDEALRLESQYAMEEAVRLCYVATTRARDRLVLLHFGGSGKEKSPPFLESFLSTQGGEYPSGCVSIKEWSGSPKDQSVLKPGGLKLDLKPYRQLWEKRMQKASKPRKPILEHPAHAEERLRPPVRLPQEPPSSSSSSSVEVGRLVHAYLERRITDRAFDQAFLEKLPFQLGIPQPDPNVLARVESILRRFFQRDLKDSSGQPLSGRIEKGRILAREIPFFCTLDGRRWHGIIDLILEERGRILAIDYKTSSPVHPLPASYLRQQQVYSQALRDLFPSKEVGFEFWWLGA
jgi:ATP-dependent exoDNAse (exonuclease V) beta subunit